ncbi:helix-hairpin-helix domain-containing protein [Sporohalobacter salinus]|uniref:helix-hairpin-helix domain-containing protein n=1 Tax=Sporohalobacter salinus TaxID=1494606 RepID=UPI0019622518|nr:helix-hairpin-helix domain-containing protein [Sporohalobacter salinus]MBM7623342.1 competence ComEA-like helix-hairpin-helix protein [Sporohalobacter salinus]
MININQANSEELQKVWGIGKVTARKIIRYRKNNGSFDDLEELTNISGISSKNLTKMKDKLTLDRDSLAKTNTKVNIEFNPRDYGLDRINEVHLVGEMNNWDPEDKTYSLIQEKDGIWRNSFDLSKGTEYKILYDSTSWEKNKYIGNLDGSNLQID